MVKMFIHSSFLNKKSDDKKTLCVLKFPHSCPLSQLISEYIWRKDWAATFLLMLLIYQNLSTVVQISAQKVRNF